MIRATGIRFLQNYCSVLTGGYGRITRVRAPAIPSDGKHLSNKTDKNVLALQNRKGNGFRGTHHTHLDIGNTQPDRLIKYWVSEDGSEAEVLQPGLWFTDFDQKDGGSLTAYAIQKIFENTVYTAMEHGFALSDRLVDKDHAIFLVSASYDFDRKINNINANSCLGVYYPLIAKYTVAHVGKSSVVYKFTLFEYKTGHRLLTSHTAGAYVDLKTRRSVAFPAFMDSLKSPCQSQCMLPKLHIPEIPATAFTCERKAFASDIDANGHVNLPALMKWCTDAATEAALRGHYSGFTLDIGNYPMEHLDLSCVGEGKWNETFEIHTWQDKDHNVVTKEGKVIYMTKFNFLTISNLL